MLNKKNKKKIINWNEISKKHIFPKNEVYIFFEDIHKYYDIKASKILRILIKRNFDLFIEHPFLYFKSELLKNKYYITFEIIKDFYNFIKSKTIILNNIHVWHKIYKNQEFWDSDIKEQLKLLLVLQEILLAINDCSKGGTPFTFRLIQLSQNKNNSYHTTISTIDRLKSIYDLLGKNYFNHHKIPIFKISQFLKLSDEQQINYYSNTVQYTIEFIDTIINYYNKLIDINIKLEKFLNPKILKDNKFLKIIDNLSDSYDTYSAMSEIPTSIEDLFIKPFNIKQDTPINQMVDTPINQIVDTPINTIIDTPINTIIDTPINQIVDTLINQIVDTPINTIIDTPINTIIDTPINTIIDTPINTIIDTPINAIIDTPINQIVDTPINPIIDTPINTIIDINIIKIDNKSDEIEDFTDYF